MNPLDNVRIVLVRSSHPGNVGAAARAMKTMGLSKLYLVAPKHFPDAQADAMAAGALDVLQAARLCAELDEGLEGTALVCAMSARPRELSQKALPAREAAGALALEAAARQVAVVFGPEKTGLSNVEVGKCQLLSEIPADPWYSSLNLAAAVQIMAYELRLQCLEPGTRPGKGLDPASYEEVEGLYRHLEETMIINGFLEPQNPGRLMQRMRRLFARTRLEKEEINILRGFLNSIR